MSRVRVLGYITCLGSLLLAFSLSAHESRPAHLEVSESASGILEVNWTRPVRNGQVLPLKVNFPGHCSIQGNTSVVQLRTILHQNWKLDCSSEPLEGKKIEIDGLGLIISDVLLRYHFSDGTTLVDVIDRKSPYFAIPTQNTASGNISYYYFRLGIEHILSGPDHLLFVLALLIIVNGYWRIIKTVTAFTLAHSLTLACAILGILSVPSPPVEAVIALSIVFLAREIVFKNPQSMTLRRPWLIAAVFGLVHGLGFAGALAEIGLPASEIPRALLMFNIGVEVGQLVFIGFMVILFALVTRLRLVSTPAIERGCSYAIGGIGAFWLVDRLAGFY